MVSITLAVDKDLFEGILDVLDYVGRLTIRIGKRELPPKYFPSGLEVRLYETAFELMECLTAIIEGSGDKGGSGNRHSAEFCYTGNFLVVSGPRGTGQDATADLFIRFNPAIVDDESMLVEGFNRETTTLKEMATELVAFAIDVHDLLLETDPVLEERIAPLEKDILRVGDLLREKFEIEIFSGDNSDEE